MNNKTILVSIASLEDPYLIPTITNALEKALNPSRIYFALGLQYENQPDVSFIENKSHILRYHPDNRPPLIQLRNDLRKYCIDYDYFLQLDAHTKFCSNWDEILINDLNNLNNFNKGKSIISKCVGDISPETDVDDVKKLGNTFVRTNWHFEYDLSMQPTKFILHGFPSHYNMFYMEKGNYNTRQYISNAYISAHFIFCESKIFKKVEMPNFSNIGSEEAAVAITFFCHGYKVFSPTFPIILSTGGEHYKFPRDKKLWNIIDENGDLNDPNNYQKRWIGDSKDQQKEIYRLFLYGENDNFSLNNKEKSIDEFYESIGLFNMWSKIRSNINLQNS